MSFPIGGPLEWSL